ncbi:hypothetical protein TrRE_jg1703, partial [Triparma retinervis]
NPNTSGTPPNPSSASSVLAPYERHPPRPNYPTTLPLSFFIHFHTTSYQPNVAGPSQYDLNATTAPK